MERDLNAVSGIGIFLSQGKCINDGILSRIDKNERASTSREQNLHKVKGKRKEKNKAKASAANKKGIRVR